MPGPEYEQSASVSDCRATPERHLGAGLELVMPLTEHSNDY